MNVLKDLFTTPSKELEEIKLDWLCQRTPMLKQEPLVSVIVATYNRPELLVTRCIPSILKQHYKNLEIIVVCDGPNAETEHFVRKETDTRIKFIVRKENGPYPQNRKQKWNIIGSWAMNEGLKEATGDYITHLDDDDEMAFNKVRDLVYHAQLTQADLIYHDFAYQKHTENFYYKEGKLRLGYVTTGSIFYRSFFKCIPWDVYCLHEPSDWNRIKKLKYVAAPNISHYPVSLLKHYKEKQSI
jgi:glycosyltransferase involved in cell wall biosynthesis